MSEIEDGEGMDTSTLLARELRGRLDATLRRAAVRRQWEQEHPGEHCGVVGDGTGEAPFVIIDGPPTSERTARRD